jgi:hypothetical protein
MLQFAISAQTKRGNAAGKPDPKEHTPCIFYQRLPGSDHQSIPFFERAQILHSGINRRQW